MILLVFLMFFLIWTRGRPVFQINAGICTKMSIGNNSPPPGEGWVVVGGGVAGGVAGDR